MSDKPTTVAVATYANKDAATQDFNAVWGIKHEGEIDHLAIALVGKKADGSLEIDRHDSSAKHLAWGGGIVGALSVVVMAPVGVALAAGTGGLIGHYWHNIPKDDVRRMGDTLRSGEFGLLIVAVNPKGANIGALLANAVKKVVNDDVADPEDTLEAAFEQTAS